MDPNQQDMSTSPFVCNISPTVKSTRINTHSGLTSSLSKGSRASTGNDLCHLPVEEYQNGSA